MRKNAFEISYNVLSEEKSGLVDSETLELIEQVKGDWNNEESNDDVSITIDTMHIINK